MSAMACGARTDLDGAELESESGCADDESCSDGLFCNGAERCVDGHCVEGEQPSCDDGDPCTADICSEEEGQCTHPPSIPDADGDGFVPIICGGDDCDDDNADIHPGAPERCNGLDDDCDDVIDELQAPVALSEEYATEGVFSHSLTAVDLGWLASWHHSGGEANPYSMSILDNSGEILESGPIEDLRSVDAMVPSSSWSPDGVSIAFVRRSSDDAPSELWLSFMSLDRHLLSFFLVEEDVDVDLLSPRIVQTDSGQGVLFRHGDFGESPSQLMLFNAVIELENYEMSEPVAITDSAVDAYAPALLWSDDHYVVAYLNDYGGEFGVTFARISPDGDVLGAALPIARTPWFPYSIALVETDEGYVVAWSVLQLGTVGEMRYALLSPEGAPIELDQPLTGEHLNSVRPSLVWTGEDIGMAWVHYPDGRVSPAERSEIRFATLSASAELLTEPVTISTSHFRSSHPELRWDGDSFGLVWTGENDDHEQLYFQRRCHP